MNNIDSIATFKSLYATPEVSVDFFYHSSKVSSELVIVFCPYLNKILDGNPYGGELLYRNGFDIISFKTIKDDWFQSIPRNLFSTILNIFSNKKYSKVIGYGSSMGGFAAIAFSKYLKMDTVIAVSPQFSIDEAFDTRWHDCAKDIDFNYKINEESINRNCNYIIFYDNKDKDSLHVDRMQYLLGGRGISIKLPNTGHPSIYYLNDIDFLKGGLVDLARNETLPNVNLMHLKKKSKSYLYLLSRRLFNKNKLSASLSIVNLCISIDSNISGYHRHRSDILSRLDLHLEALDAAKTAVFHDRGNSDSYFNLSFKLIKLNFINDAFDACSTAVDLDPNNSRKLWHFSYLLERKGDLVRALDVIEDAIRIDVNISELHLHRSRLLKSKGRIDESIEALNKSIVLKSKNSFFGGGSK